MLSADQVSRVDQAFAVYDHDWRFYSEFLGEPFLVGDCLAYFDGSILYFCAFPLTNCWRLIPSAELEGILIDFPYFSAVHGLNAWGRLEHASATIQIGERTLNLVEQSGASQTTDLVMNLEGFSFELVASARRARNSARNKGLIVETVKLDHLGWEHITLLDLFFATHEISTTHSSFYLTLPSLVKLPNVVVVEGRRNSRLMGFAVMSLPNSRVASLLMGFYDNHSGSRVSDGVTAFAIDWAKKQRISRLHLGYSVSGSLSDFKQKWGTLSPGPAFSEVFFADDSSIAASFKAGTFPWRDRTYTRANKQSG